MRYSLNRLIRFISTIILRPIVVCIKDDKGVGGVKSRISQFQLLFAMKLVNSCTALLLLFIFIPTHDSFAENSFESAAYAINQFELSYAHGGHSSHPPLEKIMNLEIELGVKEDRYVDIKAGDTTETIRLNDFNGGKPRYFHPRAIQSISKRIIQYLTELDIIGVYVEPHTDDIDKKTLRDQRLPGNLTLRLTIWTSLIKEIRTIASGQRIPEEERINNPTHSRIITLSPLKPADYSPDDKVDLLKKDLLEEFVFRLNRYPGRRVDIAVSSTGEPGEVVLDYLISENRPWFAFVQISNTGTETTDTVRERFGLVFNQLTNRDDTLSLDYVTAGFDEAHAFIGSYEFPVFSFESLRSKIHGSWSEFTASDLGRTLPIDLRGKNWNIGGEFIFNVFQHKKLFIDLIAGLEFENIVVDNNDQPKEGESDFIIPHIELELEQLTETANSFASLGLELIKADLDNKDRDDVSSLGINQLGRLGVDENPLVLHWTFQHSLYLEPLIFRKGWNDPTSWKTSTLAHELAFSFRGQFSFNNRLIPQKQMTAGGFYTVRGYEESETAGDDAYLGSIEYRFHVPRVFKPGDPKNLFPKSLSGNRRSRKPKAFKLVPDRVYGRPDWDFILRAFYDFGDTEVTDRETNEFDETLQSVGMGAEIQFLRHLNIRLDWGVALNDLEGTNTKSGDNRLHVAASFLW